MSKNLKIFVFSALIVSIIISVLLTVHLIRIHNKMSEVSESALELANANLKMDIPFEQTLPVHQGMMVEDELNARVQFSLSKVIHVNDSVIVQKKLKIPVELNVVDTIELKDNAIRISDSTLIYVLRDTIPINQDIQVLWPGFKNKKIPISANIPVDQTLYIKMDDEMTTSAKIPINIPVKTEVDYFLNMKIPIEMDIPVNIPIDENLLIKLNDPIKVNTEIPISTIVPVDVGINKTELYPPLLKMSSKLKELSSLIWPF